MAVGPKTSSLYFRAEARAGRRVTRGAELGAYSVNCRAAFAQKVTAPVSGTLVWVQEDAGADLLAGAAEAGEVIVASIEPCAHPLVYQGTCVDCEESELGAQGQLLYSSIANLRAQGEGAIRPHIDSLRGLQRLILVLDLDHTLVHAQKLPADSPPGAHGVIELPPGGQFGVQLRPFLAEFLQQLQAFFEIFVYTFGTRDYALAVLGLINGEGERRVDVA